MEPGFFRSREFAVALLAGIGVMAIMTSGAVLTGGFEGLWGRSPCQDDFGVEDISPDTDSGPRREGRETTREIVYRIAVNGSLDLADLCTDVGSIQVQPHDAATVDVIVRARMEGSTHDEVDAVRPEVVYSATPGGVRLYVHVERAPRDVTVFNEERGSVDIEVRVPAGMPIGTLRADGEVVRHHLQDVQVDRLHMSADVGDITVTNVTVTRWFEFHIDVGDLIGTHVTFLGEVIGRTDVGDVDIEVAHVANGTWDIRTDVGDVFVTVPGDDRYGYRVDIACDVGDARAEIGPTSTRSDSAGGASERVRAESQGYSERLYRAEIFIRTDVGSGTVRAV